MKSAICRGLVIRRVGKSTTGGQRKRKCVAKFRKTPCFGVKMNIKIPTVEDTIVSTYGRYYGCGGRTRTYDLWVMSKCAQCILAIFA